MATLAVLTDVTFTSTKGVCVAVNDISTATVRFLPSFDRAAESCSAATVLSSTSAKCARRLTECYIPSRRAWDTRVVVDHMSWLTASASTRSSCIEGMEGGREG